VPQPPHPSTPPPGALLGTIDEIPDGGGREVVFGEGRDAFRVLLLRRGDSVFAYRNRCPHFYLPLNDAPQRFLTVAGPRVVCSHHNAEFRFEDGRCMDGPCTMSGLAPFPLRREGDRLLAGSG
jgi:nitrite reductase/ring-hydroxylating ferredoxin subunit